MNASQQIMTDQHFHKSTNKIKDITLWESTGLVLWISAAALEDLDKNFLNIQSPMIVGKVRMQPTDVLETRKYRLVNIKTNAMEIQQIQLVGLGIFDVNGYFTMNLVATLSLLIIQK